MCARAWCIHASWEWYESDVYCAMRNPLERSLKVYQKKSKKEYFFVLREAKTKKSSSEERATSPLLGVRGVYTRRGSDVSLNPP